MHKVGLQQHFQFFHINGFAGHCTCGTAGVGGAESKRPTGTPRKVLEIKNSQQFNT